MILYSAIIELFCVLPLTEAPMHITMDNFIFSSRFKLKSDEIDNSQWQNQVYIQFQNPRKVQKTLKIYFSGVSLIWDYLFVE